MHSCKGYILVIGLESENDDDDEDEDKVTAENDKVTAEVCLDHRCIFII